MSLLAQAVQSTHQGSVHLDAWLVAVIAVLWTGLLLPIGKWLVTSVIEARLAKDTEQDKQLAEAKERLDDHGTRLITASTTATNALNLALEAKKHGDHSTNKMHDIDKRLVGVERDVENHGEHIRRLVGE